MVFTTRVIVIEHLWQQATRQDKPDDNTEQNTDKPQDPTDSIQHTDNLI